MTSEAPSSDSVLIGDTVLLSIVNFLPKIPAPPSLYAFSEGVFQNSLQLGDLSIDKTLLQCALFRIELCLTQFGGQLSDADKPLEADAITQKLENSKDNVRFGMNVRLRHLHSDMWVGVETDHPSEMVGTWDITVSAESSHHSSNVNLHAIDKNSHHIGDDLKYGDNFTLTFQADSLTFYTHIDPTDYSILSSDEKAAWKFERPMFPPPMEIDTVRLFNFVSINHSELDMALVAENRRGKVVLRSDNDPPETIWSIEPREVGGEATPISEVLLKNVASQKYLHYEDSSFSLSSKPETFIQIETEQATETDEYSLVYEQSFRIIVEKVAMLSVDLCKHKENCLKRLIVFKQATKDRHQDLEVRKEEKRRKKEAMFYFDSADQQECRKLNLIARTNVLLKQFLEELDGLLKSGPLDKKGIAFVTTGRKNVIRAVMWLSDFLTSAPLDKYISRRRMLVTTNIPDTLGQVCTQITKLQAILPNDGATETTGLIPSMIQTITKFLSEAAKGNFIVAVKMLPLIRGLESLQMIDDKGVYELTTSVLERCNPLTVGWSIVPLSQGSQSISRWISGLLPMHKLTIHNIYQQAALLLHLRVCCFKNNEFLPWYASIVFEQLKSQKRLPLMVFKASYDGPKPSFAVGPKGLKFDSEADFIKSNPSLTLSNAWKNEGHDMLDLSDLVTMPAYYEYIYNYLNLLSALAGVWLNDPSVPFGIETSVCVQLSKEVSVGGFGKCGLRLVSALILTRVQQATIGEVLFAPRPPVNPASIIGNNCYYPGRCMVEDTIYPQFTNSSDVQVCEVVDWVTKCLFQLSKPSGQSKQALIYYLTELLSTVKQLIEFGHVTRFFVFAFDRLFPYFLQGFADCCSAPMTHWISAVIYDSVNQSSTDPSPVPRAAIENCYRSIMSLGQYLLRIKRSFQLEKLVLEAIHSRSADASQGVWLWDEAINTALDNKLIPTVALFVDKNPSFRDLKSIMEYAPDIKAVLYNVVVLRSGLASWQSEQIKQYVEFVYGEMEDLLRLLCRAELLEDSVFQKYQSILTNIMSTGHISELLLHYRKHGNTEPLPSERLGECVSALQSLCSLIHPLQPNTFDADSYRNVMRHMQVQAEVHELWKIACENKDNKMLDEVMKYCVQFFYNFAYSNAINQRDLRKFFDSSMLLLNIPQLVDLLVLLGRFDSMSIKEKIEIIDSILAELPKSTLDCLYFIEVLMFDSGNNPIRQIQNYVMKEIIKKTDSLLADIDANHEALSYFLRIVSLACSGNEGMASQAMVLFRYERLEKLAKMKSSPKLLKASCDLIIALSSLPTGPLTAHVLLLIDSAVSLIDYYFFPKGLSNPPDIDLLQNIAAENRFSLFFTDFVAMTVLAPFADSAEVATLVLIGTTENQKLGGVLGMVRQLYYAAGLNQEESVKNAVFNLSKRLEKLKNTVKDFGENVNSTKFVQSIDNFFKEFNYVGESTETQTEKPKHTFEILTKIGNIALQNFAMFNKWSTAMGELITHFFRRKYLHEDPISQILFSTLPAKPQESEVHKFVIQSRNFLRNSEDKRFYFEIMRTLIEKGNKNLAVSMAECNLSLNSIKSIPLSDENSIKAPILREKQSYFTIKQALIEKSNKGLEAYLGKNPLLQAKVHENATFSSSTKILPNYESNQTYFELMQIFIEKRYLKLPTIFSQEELEGKISFFFTENQQLAGSENPSFSFEIMKIYMEANVRNLPIFMLENKVALDAVKAITHSNYENRLFAINLLLAILGDREATLLTRFRQLLEKSELAKDFFETLKSALSEVNDEIIEDPRNFTKSCIRSDKLRLIKLEFSLRTLDLIRVLCEMCNQEFQEYILEMPNPARSSILFEMLKLLMTLIKYRITTEFSSQNSNPMQNLGDYNAFFMTKATQHLTYVIQKFQIGQIVMPQQPTRFGEREMLTKAILNTLIEVVAGPCSATQSFVGTLATLYLSFNQLLRLEWDLNPKIYDISVTLLLSLLDGEPDDETLNVMSTYLDFSLLITHLKSIHDELTSPSPTTSRKQTGINVFMLLFKRKYHACKVEIEALKSFNINPSNPYYEYFIKCVGCVEISPAADAKIKKIYFPIPEKLEYLTLESKNELLFDVDRSNQKSQIHDFLLREEIWSKELEHQCYLKSLSIVPKITQNWLGYGRVAYTLVICVNLLLFYNVSDAETLYGRATVSEDNMSFLSLMYFFGAAQFFFSLLHIAGYLTEFFPNIFMRIGFEVSLRPLQLTFRKKEIESEEGELKESSQNAQKSGSESEHEELAYEKNHLKIPSFVFAVLFRTNFLYYVCYFILSFFALFYPYIFPFLLLDIVQKSSDLVTILQSITRNLSQLVLTVCLGIIIIYIFSVFGFVFFRDYFPADAPCDKMHSCFSSTFSKGIQSGGGIGDVLNPSPLGDSHYWGRFVFDLAYFIIVVVVLLNVVFGIILDTFGQLRDERNERSQDIASTCYICGENRSKIELKSSGWRYHFTGEHSPFAYLAFLIYLDGKEARDCNGLEKYVKDKKRKMDHTFMPTTSLQLMNSA